jgi:hypothetical protein
MRVTPDMKIAGKGDTFKYKGKAYWSGAINILDGVIEEVHTNREAAAADWHHSHYFSHEAQIAMREGTDAFFCVYDNGDIMVDATSRNDLTDEQKQFLAQRIREQVQILVGSNVAPTR